MSDHLLLHVELTGTTLHFADKDLHLDNGQVYEGRLIQPGLGHVLTVAYGEFMSGVPIKSSLSVVLNNLDGGLDADMDAYSWANRVVKLYTGQDEDWSSYALQYQGIIRGLGGFAQDGRQVSFQVDDLRAKDFKMLPDTFFEDGSVIPIIYGQFEDPFFVPIHLTTSNVYKIASHALHAIDQLLVKKEIDGTDTWFDAWAEITYGTDSTANAQIQILKAWHDFYENEAFSCDYSAGSYFSIDGRLHLEFDRGVGVLGRKARFDGRNWAEAVGPSYEGAYDMVEFDDYLFRCGMTSNGTDYGTMRSDDGSSWSDDYARGSGAGDKILSLAADDYYIYCGCGDGKVYRKANATDSWSDLGTVGSGAEVVDMAMIRSPGYGFYCWIVNADGEVWYYSGSSWVQARLATGSSARCIARFPNRSDERFDDAWIGDTGDDTIYRWESGTTWEELHTFTSTDPWWMLYSESRNKVVIVTSDGSYICKVWEADHENLTEVDSITGGSERPGRVIEYPIANFHTYVVTGRDVNVVCDSARPGDDDLKMEVQGYAEDGSLVEEATDVVSHMLRILCGVSSGDIDSTSKAAVQNYLKKNSITQECTVHRHMGDQKDAGEWIEELCRETGMLLRETNGKYYFDHWKLQTDPAATYTEIEIEDHATHARLFDFYANRLTVNWKYDPFSDEFTQSDLEEDTAAQSRDLMTRDRTEDWYWRYSDSDPWTVEEYMEDLIELLASPLQVVETSILGGVSHNLAERVKLKWRWMDDDIIFIRETRNFLGQPRFGLVGWNENYFLQLTDQFWQSPLDWKVVPTDTSFEDVPDARFGIVLHSRRVRVRTMIKNASFRVQATKSGYDTLTSDYVTGGEQSEEKSIKLDVPDASIGQYYSLALQIRKETTNPEIKQVVMVMGD